MMKLKNICPHFLLLNMFLWRLSISMEYFYTEFGNAHSTQSTFLSWCEDYVYYWYTMHRQLKVWLPVEVEYNCHEQKKSKMQLFLPSFCRNIHSPVSSSLCQWVILLILTLINSQKEIHWEKYTLLLH